MKGLTYSAMAKARLRANRRQYFSLVTGIFLAIFLVTTFFLAAQGFLLAQLEQTEKEVGRLDAFLLDEPAVSDETLMEFSLFQELGHVYVTARVEQMESYLGWYDDTAGEHMYRTVLEGRLPEAPGEIAAEEWVLLSLDLDRDWQLGDTLALSLVPIDGEPEERSFTLVGILADQSENLDGLKNTQTSEEFVKKFPALLIPREEPAFSTGRVAVHRTFTVENGKFTKPYVDRFHKAVKGASYGNFHIVTLTGAVSHWDEEILISLAEAESFLFPLVLGTLLALALMISCCVGIAGAMDGALARRGEEIGLLRVVGATKRQIRRIFGRESLLLAAVTAPVSILLSIGAVGLLAWLVPEQMVLRPNPWLLIPIGILSILMILLAGYLPLRRWSDQMPMGVIRDTVILRRSRGVRSKDRFRVGTLISGRLLRLYPGRQVGSGILTALMLLCAVFAVLCVNVGTDALLDDTAAFEILTKNTVRTAYVSLLPNPPLSEQSMAQLRALPHVKEVSVERSIYVWTLLEEKSDYLKSENHAFYTEEEYTQRLQQLRNDKGTADQEMVGFGMELWENMELWKDEVTDYNSIREKLGVDMEMARLNLNTVVLDESTLLKYSGWVESGKIDIEAINAGREVIVAAPKHWSGTSEPGRSYSYRGPEQLNPQDVLISENDCFYAGQTLPMIQLYLESETYSDEYGLAEAQRRDATVRVGAVLDRYDGMWLTAANIITTEEGLKNMGLYGNGYDTYKIRLDGDIDQQTEETLLRRIDAIAARTGAYSVRNNLRTHRENTYVRSLMVTVFAAISLLFTAVAVSMIVSSITRRIQSDGRRIGMLRAVGADEKTVLGCYTGQVTVSILGGYLLTAVLVGAVYLSGIMEGIDIFFVYGFCAMTGLALLSWAICRAILRLRVREILRRSIIENIREL